MKQFKIIAVRPLKNCLKHFRKTLSSETTYFLYNGYKDAEYETIERDDSNLLPNDFFRTQNGNNQLSVSVSSIVGKNGDGKSSVIELIIRILNNFSYAAGFQKNHKDLKPISRLYAKLFYSIDDVIYSITVKSNTIYWESDKFCLKWDLSKPNITDYKDLKEIEDFLFYTQISNYSIYAYNSEEFKRENFNSNECWINGVFHKNDGYQTPIVLNPWRDRGCIDVNKERNLMKDRLISLFLSSPNFRDINQKQYAKSLKITPSKKSKLETKTLYEYFENEYSNYKADNSAIRYVQKLIDELQNNQQIIPSAYYENLKDIVEKLECFEEQINQKNANLFQRCLKLKRDFFNKNKGQDRSTDFKVYLSKMKEYSKLLAQKMDSDEDFYSELEDVYERLVDLLEKLNSNQTYGKSGISLLTISEIQRVFLISLYKSEWEKHLEEYIYIHSSVGENQEIYSSIIDYFVYKSISIIEKYPSFRQYNLTDSAIEFINIGEISHNVKKAHVSGLNEIWNDMKEKKTHITLKLRQVLSFIKVNPFGEKEEIFIKGAVIEFSKYYEAIEKYMLINYDLVELLPPPIFNTDIIIEQRETKEDSLLSDLSSGERQLLNVISSIIYHLQNISSVERKSLDIISYKHICLILEEIELYFHPEFQRTFIKLLLDSIYKSQIKSIESIHICFLTHSPFILSDIPNDNILYLKKGKPEYKKDNKTLGANIHDLLANEFFMENGFMGEFSKQRIKSIIKNIRPDNDFFDEYVPKWNSETIEQIIISVGEPLIRQSLIDMYREKYKPKEITDIERQIERLQKELKDKKEAHDIN